MSSSSIKSTLVVVDKPSFFGRSKEKRLEITDLFHTKISIAVRELKEGESSEKLGLWTRLFWIPTHIILDDGSRKDILVNKNSLFKRLNVTDYKASRSELNQLSSSGIDAFFKASLSKKILGNLIENNSELAFLKNSARAKDARIEQRCETLLRAFLSDTKRFFPESTDLVETTIGFDSSKVSLISKYNSSNNKREIILKIKDTEYLVKAFNNVTNHAENKKTRLLYFANIEKAQHELNLTSIEIDQILNFLTSKDYEYLTDHLIKGPSTPKPLTVREITYPIEIKKSESGLARTILILGENKVCLVGSKSKCETLSKAEKKKEILGSGSFKTVKKVLNICDATLFACAKLKPEAYSDFELEIKKRFAKHVGISTVIDQTKSRVIEPKYEQDLLDLSSLNFTQKLGLLPSIFKGLKTLHDNNIIHRDIKPANILLKKDAKGNYSADLSDFGLSVRVGAKEAKYVAGTKYYIPPEIKDAFAYADSEAIKRYTNKSFDIYSLGKTLEIMFEDHLGAAKPLPFAEASSARYVKKLIEKMTEENVAARANWRDIELELAGCGIFI